MDTLDFGRLQDSLNLVTARQVSLFSEQEENHRRVVEEISREAAHRNAKIVAGAEASVAQKELMEEQLVELKSQNDILSEQLKAEQAQREILEEHLKVTTEQNGLLSANYQKLEEMYNAQKKSNDDATIAITIIHALNTRLLWRSLRASSFDSFCALYISSSF